MHPGRNRARSARVAIERLEYAHRIFPGLADLAETVDIVQVQEELENDGDQKRFWYDLVGLVGGKGRLVQAQIIGAQDAAGQQQRLDKNCTQFA
jgi:hypothetical protein